jgi:uncharacterized protein (PEP-CTERM system associated)
MHYALKRNASPRPRPPVLIALSGVVVMLGGAPVPAADWSMSTRSVETLTFTDNATLAPPGQAKGDMVLEWALPVRLRGEGARLKVQADYTPSLYTYARSSDLNEVRNDLRSLVSVEAVEGLAFVDATATISESYISPLAPRPQTAANVTQNRTQETTLGLSPYLRRVTGAGWVYLIRNDTYWNTYSQAGLADTYTSRTFANLEPPPSRFSTGLDYTYLYSRADAQSYSAYEQVIRARPIWGISRTSTLIGRLGYETNNYSVNDYSGSVYGAGVDWALSPRTKLDGFLEHRFFGAAFGLNLNHQTPSTVWRLTGTRNTYSAVDQRTVLRPTSTATMLDDALRYRVPEAKERALLVDQYLDRSGAPLSLTQPFSFYSDQPYISQQWTGSVAVLGTRSGAELSLLWQENEIIGSRSPVPTAGPFLDYKQFRQQGALLSVSRALTPVTAITLSGGRRTSYFSQPRNSTTSSTAKVVEDGVRLTLGRRLSPKTEASVGIRWANLNSASPTIGSYEERAVFVSLGHTF